MRSLHTNKRRMGGCELLIVVMTSRQVTCTDRHDCSVGFSMLHLLLSFVSMSVEMRRVVSRPFLSYAVRCQITCKQTRRQTIESQTPVHDVTEYQDKMRTSRLTQCNGLLPVGLLARSPRHSLEERRTQFLRTLGNPATQGLCR